ncbi:MAG: sulfur globule protein precursor [Afipia sp. 64-13]|nr:MAG: sulfur globule protein precursor [Afipia sp. 64-13]
MSTTASARSWHAIGGGGGGGHWHGGGGGHWHGGGGWHGGGHWRGGGWGWGGPRFYAGGPAYYGYYGGCTVRRLVPTPYGWRYRWINRCY